MTHEENTDIKVFSHIKTVKDTTTAYVDNDQSIRKKVIFVDPSGRNLKV